MTDRVAVAAVTRLGSDEGRHDQDLVAVEAPLTVEIRRDGHQERQSLGVLMRTPGDDEDLVVGLLVTEGVVRSASDVVSVAIRDAVATITLASIVDLSRPIAERAVIGTTACGLCGRLAVESVDALAGRARTGETLSIQASTIASLPAALRAGQAVFAETGGLHAAGLFDRTGKRLLIREDVGRHNAVDKLVGAAMRAHVLPLSDGVLVVSGRVAFEIVQKAVMAGISVIVAVGAPSSLAVDAARATRVTLVGFARDGRFNVYTGAERIE